MTENGAGGTSFHDAISATTPDWGREAKTRWRWEPSHALLASIRGYQVMGVRGGPLARMRQRLFALSHRFWSIVSGADIPLTTRIGGGLLLPHPNGIVIHPDAEIGPNCLVFQQVTIGAAHGGVPRLGGHVDIGAGAKLLGPITIGDHVQIGANAVVMCDVPDRATAVGIPARIIRA